MFAFIWSPLKSNIKVELLLCCLEVCIGIMIGKSIEFSFVVDSKRRCKGMYFATVVSKSCITILNTTHMTIELNQYKYIECIIMNPTCNIVYHPPSNEVSAEAEIFQIS